RDPELFLVPRNLKAGAVIVQSVWLPHGRGDAFDFGDAIRDVVHPRGPHSVLGFVVALHPDFHGRQHSHHFLFAYFHAAAMAVVRGAGHPRGLDQILAAQQESGALRASERLSAAIADQRRATPEVDVGYRKHLGRGVGQYRNISLLREAEKDVVIERTILRGGPGQNVYHRNPRPEGGFVFSRVSHLDDAHADGADGLVVFIARVLRDHDLVFGEPAQ